MNNLLVWNKEYRNNKLMMGDKPQKSFLRFISFVKKDIKKNTGIFSFLNLKILDLGSGNGKNSIFLAKKGCDVLGFDFSQDAILLANKLKEESKKEIKIQGGKVDFINNAIDSKFNISSDTFDIALDVTSSNSLNQKGREIYLSETYRVLKKDGYFFARGLLKDGDKNAKYLLKNFHSKEYDTYTIPSFELSERVFLKNDLLKFYSSKFKILKFEKETHYTTYDNKKYKRNFWILYMKKI